MDVRAADVHGTTPLRAAASFGWLRIVAYLADCTAARLDLQLPNRHRSTPLAVAVMEGNLDVATWLALNGACNGPLPAAAAAALTAAAFTAAATGTGGQRAASSPRAASPRAGRGSQRLTPVRTAAAAAAALPATLAPLPASSSSSSSSSGGGGASCVDSLIVARDTGCRGLLRGDQRPALLAHAEAALRSHHGLARTLLPVASASAGAAARAARAARAAVAAEGSLPPAGPPPWRQRLGRGGPSAPSVPSGGSSSSPSWWSSSSRSHALGLLAGCEDVWRTVASFAGVSRHS